MNELIKMAFELKLRQHAEYIKDWLRVHCAAELDPSLESEVVWMIDEASSSFIDQLKEQKK